MWTLAFVTKREFLYVAQEMEKLFAQLPVLPILTNPTWFIDALGNDRLTTPNAGGQNQESMVENKANIPETHSALNSTSSNKFSLLNPKLCSGLRKSRPIRSMTGSRQPCWQRSYSKPSASSEKTVDVFSCSDKVTDSEQADTKDQASEQINHTQQMNYTQQITQSSTSKKTVEVLSCSDQVSEQADTIDQAHEQINYNQQINPIQTGSSQKTANNLNLRRQASTEREDSNSQPDGALKASFDQACETGDSPSQHTAAVIDAAALESSFDLLLRRHEAVCVLVDASHEAFSPVMGLCCGFGIVIVCFVVYAMASGAMSVHELPVLTMGLFGVTNLMVLSVIIGCIVHDSVR
jgi:hypothetical protein